MESKLLTSTGHTTIPDTPVWKQTSRMLTSIPFFNYSSTLLFYVMLHCIMLQAAASMKVVCSARWVSCLTCWRKPTEKFAGPRTSSTLTAVLTKVSQTYGCYLAIDPDVECVSYQITPAPRATRHVGHQDVGCKPIPS